MPNIFADPSEREALVNDVAAKRGVASWVIEKDLWVCWTLARLNDIEGMPPLTFKGGTSLSKVHGLIYRFSEDIDLTFSRDCWGFDGDRDPLQPDLSHKRRQALVEEIGTRSAGVVRDVVIPGLNDACAHEIGRAGWEIEVDSEESQTVLFSFPNPIATYGYGKPLIRIEFGAKGDPWPTSRKRISPYVEEVHQGTASSAVVEVTALDPERTFWEKVTALHALHHGTLKKPDKNAYRASRHVFDVHRIWHTPHIKARLLNNAELLRAVVRNKQAFFREVKANYEAVVALDLNCVPHEALENTLRADFLAMGSMFFPGSPIPSFDETLATLRNIEQAVAAWKDATVD